MRKPGRRGVVTGCDAPDAAPAMASGSGGYGAPRASRPAGQAWYGFLPFLPFTNLELQYEPPHDARYGTRQCAGLGQAPQADRLGRGNRRADQARQYLLV
ncbi:protein of unknown function [Cupriavidus taiwanensis]|uniref:Uncharacterized protein n=1 Tax=Cupriavidus taiwanensis TaxID=164546 RepID=A0A375IJ73_9BURK|nr:protein of unknown function [Cupriavidus taiwanensis]